MQSDGQSNVDPPPGLARNSPLRRAWYNEMLRKILLEIVTNTQLRKCKQLKPLLVSRITRAIGNEDASDSDIYRDLFHRIHHEISPAIRSRIQHKSRYRSVNRANKIIGFVDEFYRNASSRRRRWPRSVLDVGCGEGAITNVVGRLLRLPVNCIHGCDVKPMNGGEILFTYTMLAPGLEGELPYESGQHDIVFAFMSLHHIQTLPETLRDIHRVLTPGGLFIIRDHNCVSHGLADVLDVVHGLYSMVWSNPPEKRDFETEYWANFKTAQQFHELVLPLGFELLLDTSTPETVLSSSRFRTTENSGSSEDKMEAVEAFPTIHKGKVMNPMQYYYAVYRKAAA